MTRRLLLLLAFGLAFAAAKPAAAATDGARRIAVLYFENSGNPDLEMLKLGLAEMLISDLAGQPGIEVIERGRINDLLGELDLQRTDKVDQDTAVQLGKLLGVERVVVGSYFELMGQFQLLGRVIEVETGVIIGASQHNGAVADFMTLEDQLAAGLLPYLSDVKPEEGGDGSKSKGDSQGSGGAVRGGGSGGQATASSDAETTRSDDSGAGMAESMESEDGAADVAPADPLGAALAFSEGLDYLDRKDMTRARDALRRAVELDPSLEAARTELAAIDI